MSSSPPSALYFWMRPAWAIGRVRPGLRSAIAADAVRLRELPAFLGSFLLPALAVLLPTLLSVGHATTHKWFWTPKMATPSALIIYDVFTESVPFMVAAGVIGLMSPAAGALLAIVYAIGNLAVTIRSEELIPVVGATFGRLVTYLVLWLLVVEIPLMGRSVYEWWSARDDAIGKKRVVAIAASTVSVGALSWMWVLGAPLLIVVMFFMTPSWQQPPYPPFGVMTYYGWIVVVGMTVATPLVFAARYLGRVARVAREEDEPGPGLGSGTAAGYLGSLVLVLVTLASVIHGLADAAVLIGGLLLARPVARLVLRATGLAPALAAIARPIRLIAGFGVTLAFAWGFIAIVGVSSISPFFNAVIAIAAGLIIMEIFLAADDVVAGTPAPPSAAGGTVGRVIGLAAVFFLTFPTLAWADNMANQQDVNGMAAAAAASAAGAKAWDAAKKKKFPPKPLGGADAGTGSGGGGSGSGGSGSGGGGSQPGGGGAGDGGTPDGPPPPWYYPDGLKF